jgi:hypothetical protein
MSPSSIPASPAPHPVCDASHTMPQPRAPGTVTLRASRTALCIATPLLFALLVPAQEKPLPNPDQLRQRALATYDRTRDQRENYECREHQVQNDLDSKGRNKKTTVLDQDFFFVNGRPILREVTRDGKPLTPGETHAQDERVRKEINEAEKAAKKQNRDRDTVSSGNFLRMAKLNVPRRVTVSGRPTIVFNVVDDPDRGGDIAQRVVSAMRGTMSIDEDTGHVQDLNITGVRDVKIGGGLVANIHKGFQLHAVFAPQPDGVWLAKAVYGSGDARVGLFLHPRANFQSQVLSCHLFNVEADSTVKEIEGKK